MNAEELKSLLIYNPDTGVFIWRNPTSRNISSGDIAGSVNTIGYSRIQIHKKSYLAHRLAWLYMTGAWPKSFIDHIDRNPRNNRFCNLREATMSQNKINSPARADSKTGIRGVCWSATNKKWLAQVWKQGKRYAKHFDSIDDAESWVKNQRAILYGHYAQDA